MKDKVLIHDHLNWFNPLLTELMGIGVKIDEEEQIPMLLCSLSDSWDNLIISVVMLHKWRWTRWWHHFYRGDYEKILGIIKSNFKFSSIGGKERSNRSRGNSVTSREKSRGRSKSKRDLGCYYCDKPGQMKKDSWKHKKYKGNDNNNRDGYNTNVGWLWERVFDSRIQFQLGNWFGRIVSCNSKPIFFTTYEKSYKLRCGEDRKP